MIAAPNIPCTYKLHGNSSSTNRLGTLVLHSEVTYTSFSSYHRRAIMPVFRTVTPPNRTRTALCPKSRWMLLEVYIGTDLTMLDPVVMAIPVFCAVPYVSPLTARYGLSGSRRSNLPTCAKREREGESNNKGTHTDSIVFHTTIIAHNQDFRIPRPSDFNYQKAVSRLRTLPQRLQ
jgi:hypothetical protein